jgi:hypothetical protein
MSAQKKARGLPGMKEGPLVQMLDRQRVQQAAADEANDFIDDELDSENVSEQRASASLPDSVPIESEEERAAREADEMAALDSVGDYEADPNVMLEDVPQDIVIKTLKVSCAYVPVLVFVCVCVCACTLRRYVFVRICICIF